MSLLLAPASLVAICLFAWAIAVAFAERVGLAIYLFPAAVTVLLLAQLFGGRKPPRVLTPYQRWLRKALRR